MLAGHGLDMTSAAPWATMRPLALARIGPADGQAPAPAGPAQGGQLCRFGRLYRPQPHNRRYTRNKSAYNSAVMRNWPPMGQAVRKATSYAACGRDEGPPPTASAGGRAVCCPAYACLRSRCARLCNLSPCRRARPLRRPCPAPLPGLSRVRQLQAGLPVACQARPPSIRHRPRSAVVPRRWLATAQASPGAGGRRGDAARGRDTRREISASRIVQAASRP